MKTIKEFGLILMLWGAVLTGSAYAQGQQSIGIALCGTIQRFCVQPGTTKSLACIVIKIPAGNCAITKMEIDWDDNKPAEVFSVAIPKMTKDTTISRTHEYDLTAFTKSCTLDQRFDILLTTTFVDCNGKEPFLSPGIILFRNSPVPTISASRTTVCIGQRVDFNVNLCPSTGAEYTIDYGDGTSGTDRFHTYPKKGNYTVTVSASNSCNVDAPNKASVSLTIIESATAMLADSGARVITKDTSLVCLTNGRAIIRLDGSGSPNADQYYWSGPGQYLAGTSSRSSKPLIEFTSSGIFTITLEVDNPCGQRSQPVKHVYRVLNLPQLTLPKPDNFCLPITFKIDNPIQGAIYTIDEKPIPAGGVFLDYSAKTYVLTGSLSNECTATPVQISHSFSVQKAEPVKITSLRDTSLCAGSKPVLLLASLPDGSWTGAEQQNGVWVFNPKTAGTYTVRYDRGKGDCAVSDRVTITVQGVDIQVANQSVCANTPFVKLGGLPAGGHWKALDCAGCVVRGDTLFLGTTPVSLVTMEYQVTGNNSCSSQKTALISITRPRITELAIKGGCAGKPAEVTVSVSGSNEYSWYLNDARIPFSTAERPILNLPAGRSIVKLVLGSGTCIDSLSREVVVTALAEPVRFTATPLRDCSPATVRLNVTGVQQAGLSYTWTVDDRVVSRVFQPDPLSLQNQTTQPQTYKIRFAAENACNEVGDEATVTVLPRAKAVIGVDSTDYRCGPALVTLSNRSVSQKGEATWLLDGKTITTSQDRLTYQFVARDSITTYTIRLVVQSECGPDTAFVRIRVYPTTIKPLFRISKSDVCVGETIRFDDATPQKGEQWTWKFTDNQNLSGSSVDRFFSTPGTYKVKLVVRVGCVVDSVERSVVVRGLPSITARLLTPTVCQGQVVQLELQGSPSFLWRPEGLAPDSVRFSPEFTFASSGSKTILLTVFGNSKQCKRDTAFRATVRPIPTISNLTASEEFVCSGFPIRLEAAAANAVDFIWRVGSRTHKQIFGGQKPVITVPSGTYDVYLNVSDGVCVDSTQRFTVFTVDSCVVGLPEAFSPGNGDGVSDQFTIFGGKGVLKIKTLKVFDGWGAVIFFGNELKPNDLTMGWDGTANGVPMPTGNYPYQADIELAGSTAVVRKTGIVRLVRR